MDTDPQFLQALASRKRGKKKEDQFDRDFNALRISAPVNGQTAPPESVDDYRLMNDLDFDAPAPIGNFMRIVLTTDVFRKDKDVSRPQPPQKSASGLDENGVWRGQKPWDDPKWATRPNYKAFVRNNKRPSERHPVSVALAPVEDYGMGNAYWKGDQHSGKNAQQTQKAPSTQRIGVEARQGLDEDFGGLNISAEQRSRTRTGRLDADGSIRRTTVRSGDALHDDAEMDDAVEVPEPRGKSREHSVGYQTAAPSTSRGSRTRRIHTIEEDDDDDEIHVMDVRSSSTRSKRSMPAVSTRGVGRKRATDDEESVIAVEDVAPETKRRGTRTGEAGSTLVSSGGKRTPVVSQQEQRKRTQALAAMDDSDDDIRVKRKRKK